MRYTIYFIWNDGTEDSFNVTNAKDRDFNINEMLKSREYRSISYCKLYSDGEHGSDIKIK